MSQKEYILKLLESDDPELIALGYELMKGCIDPKIFAASFKNCEYSPEELVDAYIYWAQTHYCDDIDVNYKLLKIVSDTLCTADHSIYYLLIRSIK